MKDSPTTKWPRMEACPTCGGSGLISHYSDGSPNECQVCGATGRIQARDKSGRYLAWEEVNV
jgi:DnaJ-class molecular chaperone